MRSDGSGIAFDFSEMPKHLAFLHSTVRFPALFGGWGAAKTVALCAKIMKHLMDYPGTTAALGRNTVPELQLSTMKTWFELMGCSAETAYSHPDVKYWNATKRHLILRNGSDIFFVYLEDESALNILKGPNISVVGIDQAEEINEEVFAFCDARARHGDCPNWVALAGNPAGHNWIWRRFFRTYQESADHEMWVVKTADNIPLMRRKPEYLRSLIENHPKEWVDRYVYGSFDSYVGNVYKEWDPKVHIIPKMNIPDAWKRGYGADFGFRTHSAFVGVAIDYQGNKIIYDEVRGKEMIPEDFCLILKDPEAAKENRHRIASPFEGIDLPIYGDPAMMNRDLRTGTNLQEEYFRHGVFIQPGNRMRRIVGIERIKEWLKVDYTKPHPYNPGVMGACRLYVAEDVTGFLDEVENYQYKQQKETEVGKRSAEDEVLKVDDHSLDAFRYWGMNWAAFDVTEKPREAPTPGTIEWAVPQAIAYRKSATTDWRAA